MAQQEDGNAAFVWTGGELRRLEEPPRRATPRLSPHHPSTPEDARRYPRLDLQLPILYRVVGAGRSHIPAAVRPYLLAQSRDVSPLGLCLALEEALPPGVILALTIHLPEEREKFEALGRVVWCRAAEDGVHHLVGLQFVVVDGRRVREERHVRMEELLRRLGEM